MLAETSVDDLCTVCANPDERYGQTMKHYAVLMGFFEI